LNRLKFLNKNQRQEPLKSKPNIVSLRHKPTRILLTTTLIMTTFQKSFKS